MPVRSGWALTSWWSRSARSRADRQRGPTFRRDVLVRARVGAGRSARFRSNRPIRLHAWTGRAGSVRACPHVPAGPVDAVSGSPAGATRADRMRRSGRPFSLRRSRSAGRRVDRSARYRASECAGPVQADSHIPAGPVGAVSRMDGRCWSGRALMLGLGGRRGFGRIGRHDFTLERDAPVRSGRVRTFQQGGRRGFGRTGRRHPRLDRMVRARSHAPAEPGGGVSGRPVRGLAFRRDAKIRRHRRRRSRAGWEPARAHGAETASDLRTCRNSSRFGCLHGQAACGVSPYDAWGL